VHVSSNGGWYYGVWCFTACWVLMMAAYKNHNHQRPARDTAATAINQRERTLTGGSKKPEGLS